MRSIGPIEYIDLVKIKCLVWIE